MAKFDHFFKTAKSTPSSRIYESGENFVRLDFVSESCLRVAVYGRDGVSLPTFCVNPDNKDLTSGRDRLSTDGFNLCEPEVKTGEETDSFKLPCGVEIALNKHNFLLEYRLNDNIIFSDRAPLAYNFGGEFGSETYHYVTRQEGEYIFGLGDKGGALNKSGRSFRIETGDCMGYNAAESDPLYKHIPFYICENKAGCYGIFYDTSDTSYFDFGREINNYYPPYKYFKTQDDCLVYYVFFGTKFSVLQQFARLCGKQAFAPKWSFSYCASTMAYTDAPDSEKQFGEFLEKLDEYELNCEGFYLSSGYTSIGDKRYVFNWNTDKFPSPERFIKEFEDRGIHIIPNIKPVLLQTHPLYGEMAEKGLFVKNEDGTPLVGAFWDGLGSFIDFTNEQAVEYWKEKVTSTLLDLGICATWNDNNEFEIKDLEALAEGFGKGKVRASRIRPVLTYLMTAASYSAQIKKNPEARPFLSTRSGNIAVRRLAQTWSGDNRTCFEDLRYCHNIGLTMSLSGVYFYGHDLGGFYGQKPSRELLLRWLQHGIFEPRFTIHSWNTDGSSTMAWTYPDIMPAVKALFNQRQKLLPYLYNCAYEAVENEIPLNAPPVLYYDDEQLYSQNDCMLVGTDILVPFVFDEGKEKSEVYLPEKDDWYLNGKLYSGGSTLTVDLPAEGEVPYFVKAGSIIATNCEGETVFTVYPTKAGEFKSTFFDDDGVSFKYKDGECVKLEFTAECNSETVTVKYENKAKKHLSPKVLLCEGDGRKLIV